MTRSLALFLLVGAFVHVAPRADDTDGPGLVVTGSRPGVATSTRLDLPAPLGTCTNDEDCDDGLFCNGIESCDTGSGNCVAVSSCPPFLNGCLVGGGCDEDTDTCTEEPDDSLCDDGMFCNGIESCDADTGGCAAVSSCPPFVNGCLVGGGCDEDTDTCTEEPDDSLCDDGMFCNGIESCDADTGGCAAVSSCPPFVNGCLVGGGCDEDTDTCTEEPDDSLCDDGMFCNGIESCDADTGGCAAVSSCPPFVNGCLVGGGCDEDTDTCTEEPDDSLCDDGMFCNGIESCDADTGGCAAVSSCPPFVNGCLIGGGCDEDTDTCTEEPDDSLCDDGMFCNGIESCDAGSGGCVAVSSCPPFVNGCLIGGGCDEVTDTCLEEPDDGLCGAEQICTPDGQCIPGNRSVLFGVHNDDGAQTSVLYSIDPDDGALNEVGPGPFEVFGSMEDMAALDGLLWIATGPGTLWAVNMNSGQPIGESLRVTLSGTPVPVEGLTATDGRLVVGFRPQGSSAANSLGIVSPFSGAIDPASVVPFDDANADFDGLGTNTANELFSTDVALAPGKDLVFDIYAVGTSPPSYAIQQRFDRNGDTACSDLTFVTAGAIFCADSRAPFELLEIDPLTYDVIDAFPFESEIVGIAAAGPPGTLFTVRVDKAGEAAVLSWDEHRTAQSYDVVAGDLDALRQSNGDFSAATTECRANDFLATDLVVVENPDRGAGLWYLVRGEPRGSYGSAFPSQVGIRDTEIETSALGCD